MPPMDKPGITIVGLGPGDARLLTVEAVDALASAADVWLRTSRHPAVAGLPAGPAYHSFDEVYDTADTFDGVYDEIARRVVELAARLRGAVYAVPGHPLAGEATTAEIRRRAAAGGIDVRVIAGLSFIDVVALAIGLDPLADGLLVLDALSLGAPRRLFVPQRPTLIAQMYDRHAASGAKLALLEAYPAEHRISIVRAAGTDAVSVIETDIEHLDHTDRLDHLTSLYVPPLPLTDDVRSFEGLRAVIAQLRAPDGGCPWDLEQTHETLKHYLLEEAYETIDALDEGEPTRLAEELGDLLMQIVLHAQVAEDNGDFLIEDVLASISKKLVRRHPHVFGDTVVAGSSDVLRNWDELKKDERGDAPVLDAVPVAMPALAQAQSVQGRAERAGLVPQRAAGSAPTIELDQLDQRSLGALLFEIVAVARERGLDAEEALRLAIRDFRASVAAVEATRQV